MITKELFTKCLNNLKEYTAYENKLANLDINIFERKEVSNFITSFIELLQYCCDDIPEYKNYPSDIEYFIYDCNFGEKANDHHITITENDESSKEIILKDVDSLWDYLVDFHPDIPDIIDDNLENKKMNKNIK